jgi:choline dehydrogenase-like flavoprotein
VLEEGRKIDPEQMRPKPSWAYRNLYAERNTRLMSGNVHVPLPGGRVVGGSTVVNSGICFRTPKKVLRRFREEFGIPWASERVLAPLFEQIEAEIGVAKTHPTQARGNNLIFKQGADALGIQGDFISRNAPGCVGCGMCQMGCPIGAKGSVDRNLIPAALSKEAALFSSARAEKLLLRDGFAVGVVASILDPSTDTPLRQLTVRARKVFLCAGAVHSPMFLQDQKLCGQSGHLGKNLRVHPAGGVCARFPQIIDAWDGATQGYYVPLEDSILETFSSTPDIYYTQFAAFANPPAALRHVASCGVMLGDESSGELKRDSSTGRARIRYDLQEVDKRKMVRGLREMARIYFAAGATAVHSGVRGAPLANNLREVEAICREDTPVDRFGVYASHPMGTCRMGSDPTASVVSPTGETHEVRGLYVADASVFPCALGVNPQVTVMTAAVMIARQAAEAG